MERLILLRHGKAEADAASGQDFDRALTERGRADAVLVARALAEAGVSPDLVLVSPAVRAAETWQAAQPAFPRARSERTPALYHVEPDEILALAGAQSAATVMIVGHNPGLGELAAIMATRCGSAPVTGLPTAGAAVIEFKDRLPEAVRLFLPKTLGSAG